MLELFNELYDDWFNNSKYWFCKNEMQSIYDIFLSKKYFSKIKYLSFTVDCLKNQDKKVYIGAIIAFDQIPRHHNRLENIDCNEFSDFAKEISLFFMKEISDNKKILNSITAHEWCFILLPFRHVKDVNKVNYIIDFIHHKYSTTENSEDKKIYKKFLNNSLNDVYKLNTELILKKQMNTTSIVDNIDNQWNLFKDILDFCPSYKIKDNIDYYRDNHIVKTFYNELQKINKDTHIIVSISGGVDSCVCLHLLSYFFPNGKITAVHVNYNNRLVCKKELRFVQKYCSVLNIKLIHRTIKELYRDRCHNNGLRDIYENTTRNIRFDLYKQVANLYPERDYIVLLGHNKDDCFENILTNISTKKHYDNLSGISVLSIVENICFWRPLLNIRKSTILDYATNMYIPFLKDSTPKWSMRGKIRDNILPKLEDINGNIIDSFFSLKEHMKKTENLIENSIVPMTINKFIILNNEIIGNFYINELICDYNIWNRIFYIGIFKEMIEKRISHKCIEEFIDFLQRFKTRFDFMKEKNIFNMEKCFVLCKNIKVFVCRTKDNKIKIIFKKV